MCKNHVTPINFHRNWIFWQIGQPLNFRGLQSSHLDLGSGKRPANPFNCDVVFASDVQDLDFENSEGIKFLKITNFSEIPLPDNSLESISAYDLLEHIPREWPSVDGTIRYPFIDLMNEISRVLKPGGIFLAVTPAFPSPAAFQDPTHINIISTETIKYFDQNAWATELGYGYNGSLSKVHQSWLRGAGPYLGRMEKFSAKVTRDSNKGFGYKLKLINRTIRLFKPNTPISLLWVLRKNCI